MAYFKLFSILAFVAFARAHMEMSFPPPLRSKYNPNVDSGKMDYSMTSPLSGSGSNFPCKSYQSDLGTPAGASVVTWTQGSSVNFTIVGGAVHGGGSCQAALSYDSGKSWKVIHSFIGSCPLSSGQDFQLTIPSDAPKGAALFAWTWYNQVGNREIYQNCASITIAGGSGTKRASTVAFSSRPDMFVANLGNGCTTVETEDVVFPNPGPDVIGSSTKSGTGFTGTCAAVGGIGGGSSSSSSGGSAGSPGTSGTGAAPAPAASSPAPPASSPAANSPAPVASSASSASVTAITIIPVTSSASTTASSFITSTTSSLPSASAPSASSSTGVAPVASSGTSTGSAPASTGSSTSGVTPTVDGQCSGTQTCAGTSYGQCCSQWGFCGVTSMHCGTGCMEAFSGAGACGKFGNATTTAAARVRAVKARGLFSA